MYEQLAPFVQPRLGDRHFMDSFQNANSMLTDIRSLYKHSQRYRRQLHDDASSDLPVSPRDFSTPVSGEESITLTLASLDYLTSRDIEDICMMIHPQTRQSHQEISLHQSQELNPSYWYWPVGTTRQL